LSGDFDVVVIGAGIAGLATALVLFERNPRLKIALISPGNVNADMEHSFGSNQPAIASHPHFSKDHNLLSQWTAFSLPHNEAALQKAFALNADVALARGRWQLAKTTSDALDIQARIAIFNAHVPKNFCTLWRPDIGPFGALWLESAWAVSPAVLQQVWIEILKSYDCCFLQAHATAIETGASSVIRYTDEPGNIGQVTATNAIICSPACLHSVVYTEGHLKPPNILRPDNSLPLIQWPGQSQRQHSAERTGTFGKTIVQNDSYAIPLGDQQWLVRDEPELALEPYRGNRWHTPDRLPYVGAMFDTNAIISDALRIARNDLLPLPSLRNLYLNTGHGTRGLLSGIAGATIVADLLLGANTSMPRTLAKALNPNRYVRRALRTYFANLQSD
jgi:glycine/D-amino acid oxidase-like deaminating enzyme